MEPARKWGVTELLDGLRGKTHEDRVSLTITHDSAMSTELPEAQIERINSCDDLLKKQRELSNKFVQLDCDHAEFMTGIQRRSDEFVARVREECADEDNRIREERQSLIRQEQMLHKKLSDLLLDHNVKVVGLQRREDPPIDDQQRKLIDQMESIQPGTEEA